MTSDDRAYIEFRFDSKTADVVLVGFADSFGEHTSVVVRDWTFSLDDHQECSILEALKGLLVQIVEEL